MPNLDGESYSDVTLSFLCLIVSCFVLFYLSYLVSFRLVCCGCLILSYLISFCCFVLLACVACACSVYFRSLRNEEIRNT